MDKKEDAKLKALQDRLEIIRDRTRYGTSNEKARREAEEAILEAIRTRKETIIAHEEALRAQEHLKREEAWWDSVKNLPPKERVREIFKHHERHGEKRTPEDRLTFFPMGEA